MCTPSSFFISHRQLSEARQIYHSSIIHIQIKTKNDEKLGFLYINGIDHIGRLTRKKMQIPVIIMDIPNEYLANNECLYQLNFSILYNG
jgi:hypothetical protein